MIWLFLSANTTALLVKDGIATTMEKALVQIGFSPSIRLRLLLNVLNYLSKNSEFSSEINLITIVKTTFGLYVNLSLAKENAI